MPAMTKAKKTSLASRCGFISADGIVGIAGVAGIAGMLMLAAALLIALHVSKPVRESAEFSETEPAIPQETLAQVVAIGGNTGLDANGTAMLGIDINLLEGWKTYWRLPWESGLPPLLDWSGSRNLQSARVLWPAPFRFEDAGGAYFGYQEQVLLPVAVRAEDKQRPLQAELLLRYAVCKHVCIPLQQRLAWNLVAAGQSDDNSEATTSAAGDATTDADKADKVDKARLDAALARLPVQATPAARFLDARLSGEDSESPSLEVRLLLSESLAEASTDEGRDSFLLVEQPAPAFFGRERLLETGTEGDDGTDSAARVARYSLPLLHSEAAAALRADGARLMFRIDGDTAIAAQLPVQATPLQQAQ